MDETEVLANYRRKVAQAEQTARDLLKTRIAQIKQERDQALAKLKEEAELGNAGVQGSEEREANLEKASETPAAAPE